MHLLQYSGAIWWPWTYELPAAAQRRFGAAKRANGLDRALRYVTAIGARQVVPFAGPACFLDEDLFGLNDLTRGWYAEQHRDEDDIRLGDWIIQRRCPHLRGDLGRFGRTGGTTLTCTMHGWQFDLPTGRCLATDASTHHLRSRPAPTEAR